MLFFAIWVLLSGLDDLVLDIACLYRWMVGKLFGRGRTPTPTEAELANIPHKRIAIFVPLWKEYGVIRNMIEHNVVTPRYDKCDFFIGVYPNDDATVAAVRELDARFPNVHLAMCPHNGPTSKADNLNWVFQRMLQYEATLGARFEIVMTHDAEDLLHPEELRWVNYYGQHYDMVQIPVLPLATPVHELLHGVYCDEFAEYQTKDMPIRPFLGGFLPSCGVGTGFSRVALERLANAHSDCIFEPRCLTEDYENGFRLHRLGCSQVFVPVTKHKGTFVATRGYFPRSFRAAVKQRTRWITGIALQSWEMHGWRDTLRQFYWFWRDRKGLAGSLLSPAANVVFLYGAGSWYIHGMDGHAWRLLLDGSSAWVYDTFVFSMALQAVHLSLRMRFSARIYGWRFASLVPVRVVYGNVINLLATMSALRRYFQAKWAGRALIWLKTEHAYPSGSALENEWRKLGEILVGSQYLPSEELDEALQSQPAGVRIGEHLVRLGKLSESDLYECLSLQQKVSFEKLDLTQVSRPITRALPAHVARKWKVLGYKVASGQLFLAGPDVPSPKMSEDLRHFSSLEIRFHLVTPANFQELVNEFLPPLKSNAAAAG